MSIGEHIEDVDTGAASEVNEDGLTAEEKAQFDQMARGEPSTAEREAAEGAEPDDEPIDGDDAHDDGEPEQVADGQPAEGTVEEPRKNPKTVSFGRHQRELRKMQEERDKANAERETERTERIKLDERTRMLMEAIKAKTDAPPAAAAAPVKVEEPADPEPDAEEDPFEHARWTRRELGRTQKILSDIQNGITTERQNTQQQNEEQRTYSTFTADIERAAKEDPNYADAFVHMRESRFTELGFIFGGIDINDKDQCATLSPQQQAELSTKIQQAFYADQMEVARSAIKAGQSPAKAVFNLARARGFTPKQAEAAQAAEPAARAAPAARTAAPAAAPSVKDQLATIREGQNASKSLSDAGGSPGGQLSIDRLTKMSDDEFNELYDSMSKGQFDRLLGKPAVQ